MEEQIWIKLMKKSMIKEINMYDWKNIKKCHIISLYDNDNYLKIPECVEELRFSAIFKQKINNLIIPSLVKLIYFIEWNNPDLSNLIINNYVILHFERITKLSAKTLPKNLNYLIIDYLDFPLEKLPSSLLKLTIKYDNDNLDKSKIPIGCQVQKYL